MLYVCYKSVVICCSQREPQFDVALDKQIAEAADDFTRIALKAKAAKDYFLLVGPPGTGKTSCALEEDGRNLL